MALNPMTQVSVAAIILNWNSTQETLTCLNHLLAMHTPQAQIYPLVLDNGSNPEEWHRLQAQIPSRIALLREPSNLGFSGGVNRCLEYLRGRSFDFYWLLNNDTEPSPQLLTHLIDSAMLHPEAWVLGAVILPPSGSSAPPDSTGWIRWWSGTTVFLHEIPNNSKNAPEFLECDLVHGACFLIRAEAITRLGGLDPDYFAYYEESDFCVRARRAGGRVGLVPSAQVVHMGSVSADRVSGMREYLMMRNRILFVKKNGTRLQWLSTLFYALAYYGPKRSVRAAIYGSWASISWLWQGWFAGVFGLDPPFRKSS